MLCYLVIKVFLKDESKLTNTKKVKIYVEGLIKTPNPKHMSSQSFIKQNKKGQIDFYNYHRRSPIPILSLNE